MHVEGDYLSDWLKENILKEENYDQGWELLSECFKKSIKKDMGSTLQQDYPNKWLIKGL